MLQDTDSGSNEEKQRIAVNTHFHFHSSALVAFFQTRLHMLQVHIAPDQ